MEREKNTGIKQESLITPDVIHLWKAKKKKLFDDKQIQNHVCKHHAFTLKNESGNDSFFNGNFQKTRKVSCWGKYFFENCSKLTVLISSSLFIIVKLKKI